MGHTQTADELTARVTTLTEQIVDRVWEQLPGYSAPRMRRRELALAVTPNVLAILERVRNPDGDDTADVERARELGRTRALQGLKLDTLLASYRTAERVLIDAWLGTDSSDPDATRTALALIGHEVDRLSGASIEAYRLVAQQITSHYEGMAAGLVTRLVEGDIEPYEVAEVARSLRLDPTEPVQAIALRHGVLDPDVRTIVKFQRAALSAVTAHRHGNTLVGRARETDLFVVTGEMRADQRDLLLCEIAAFRDLEVAVGVGSPVARLADAGVSCRQALLAVDTAWRHDPIVHVDDVLLEVAVAQSSELQDRLDELVAQPLLDQEALARTAAAYLDTRMSGKLTAARLGVHVNTVAYRLRRMQELTGFDPRDPRDLVLLALGSMGITARGRGQPDAGQATIRRRRRATTPRGTRQQDGTG